MDAFQLIELNQALKPITTFFNYVTHPSWIWNGFVDASYWVALIFGSSCIILYVCGHNKAKKYVFSSAVIYAIIQAIGKAGM